jgi:hypothetical protein
MTSCRKKKKLPEQNFLTKIEYNESLPFGVKTYRDVCAGEVNG